MNLITLTVRQTIAKSTAVLVSCSQGRPPLGRRSGHPGWALHLDIISGPRCLIISNPAQTNGGRRSIVLTKITPTLPLEPTKMMIICIR